MMKKTTIVGVVFMTICVVILVLQQMSIYKDNVEKEIASEIYMRLAEFSDNNKYNITIKIDEQLTMLGMLASTIGQQEEMVSEKTLKMMNNTVETYGFLRCVVTSLDGHYTTHSGETGVANIYDDYMQHTINKGPNVTGPRSAIADDSKYVILLSVPIMSNGEIRAVLTATYETSYLHNVFQSSNFGGKGRPYIVGSTGSNVYVPIDSKDMLGTADVFTFFRQNLDAEKYRALLENIRDDISGSFYLEYNGKKEYVHYQPLEINGWYVFSLVSGDVLDTRLDGIVSDTYNFTFIVVAIFIVLVVTMLLCFFAIRNESKKQLYKMAYEDRLTGSANANLFKKQSGDLLGKSNNGEYAYVILNIRRFKVINDIFGYEQGNQLLCHVANILRSNLDSNEGFCRFESDCFHILMKFNSEGDFEARLTNIAKEIADFKWNIESNYLITLEFGIYVIDDKTKHIDNIGDKARMALAKIKNDPSKVISWYNQTIGDEIINQQHIENHMHEALANQQFELYLQPKYDTLSCALCGAEALVRWHHPEQGFIMPGMFIPIFEQNGFISKLDFYMLEKLCQLLQEWRNQGLRLYTISVNQSRKCFYEPDYIAHLLNVLKKYDIEPQYIELEITESLFFEDGEKLINVIYHLKEEGFKVSIDDFGSAYSSLNMLQDTLVDVLKIDRNFLKESVNSERGKKIVQQIVEMARSLNMNVVAEGVETKEQLEFLQRINCNMVQGYYFSPAISNDKFHDLLVESMGISQKL